MALVDSHCHLADAAFEPDLPAVVERARAAGVEAGLCILSADEPDEVGRAAAVRTAWPAVRFAAAIHPHRAAAFEGRPEAAAALVDGVLDTVSGVAVGEVGLDYHYDFAPKRVQQDTFLAQAALAVRRRQPIVVHTREAFADTIAIVRQTPGVRGVLHCFTGTIAEAREALDLGFFVSLAGIVTFPKASDLRALAQYLPLDRILVETDAPYLAPVPHRGKRNEPAWVAETVRAIAAARGEDVRTLADAVANNFTALLDGDDRRPPR